MMLDYSLEIEISDLRLLLLLKAHISCFSSFINSYIYCVRKQILKLNVLTSVFTVLYRTFPMGQKWWVGGVVTFKTYSLLLYLVILLLNT